MSAVPNFVATPQTGIALLSTANTNRDGLGVLGTVVTAGANGSRVDAIQIKATGTTTAGAIRLFIHDGTNARLLTEFPVYATTPSATLPSFEHRLDSNQMNSVLPIILPANHSLRASTNNAELFNVISFGGSF